MGQRLLLISGTAIHAASLGKIPTTRDRPLISLLIRSSSPISRCRRLEVDRLVGDSMRAWA